MSCATCSEARRQRPGAYPQHDDLTAYHHHSIRQRRRCLTLRLKATNIHDRSRDGVKYLLAGALCLRQTNQLLCVRRVQANGLLQRTHRQTHLHRDRKALDDVTSTWSEHMDA